MTAPCAISLRPWRREDLDLLVELNSPVMTRHLGGPEPATSVRARLEKYVQAREPSGRMFVVVDEGGARVGSVGYWRRVWGSKWVYEIGWGVLPGFQGRGTATAGVAAALRRAAGDWPQGVVHAFPSVDNAASNAICRTTGFTLVGECEFEYPAGRWMRCRDWRYELDDRR